MFLFPQSSHGAIVNEKEGSTCKMIPPALHPSATMSSTTGLMREYNPPVAGRQDWKSRSINSCGTTPAISWIDETVTPVLDMMTSPSVVFGENNLAEVWR
jgi:hypothetical protein